MTDEKYEAAPIREKAVAQADHCVGERESGWNGGVFVTMLLDALSVPRGSAWCAAFVSFVLRKAGYEGGPKGYRRARVKEWADWAASSGCVHSTGPKRGDLFFWLNDDLTGHMGFVLGEPDFAGEFRTLEGNTNTKGSREGDGVYKRERTLKPGGRMRFIRWWEV